MKGNSVKYIISREQILEINNKFRSLGLSFKLSGTKFLNKTVQIIIASGNEFYVLEDVLDEIIKLYPNFNKIQIRMAMKYALDHRDENLSKRNFEKIFGFEYNEEMFFTRNFIDEFVNIMSIY